MKNDTSLKFTILSISFLLMTRITISPALAEIGKAFPSVSKESLMMMVVLPSLVGIVFGFISSVIADFFKAKKIIYTGLIIFLIGGVGPVFTENFKVLLLCRVLLGAGTGLFLPFSSGLIAVFFTGDQRNKMIGFQSTAVGVGNIITSILAGVLAAIYWKLSFLIYAFAVVTLLLVIFYLPEPPKVEGQKTRLTAAQYFNKGVLMVCFLIFLYSIIYFAFFGYLAFVIDADHLGDSKSAGLATMLMTMGSMIMGVLFGKIVKIIKSFSLPLSLLANVIGYYILANAASLSFIFAGSLMIGLGFGFLMPYAVMVLNDASDKSAYNYSNGLFMTSLNVGTAISPKILVTIGEIFNNSDGKFIFLCCAILLGGAAVISLLLALMPKRSPIVATE